ncbi:Hypothetical predicted protein [Octopus vulgaris]|uniref:Uncharacterized protein n=1 Tax=Octopus vulgaris TaxID=6645 RepID=A0AA36AMW1_OCTVU|nr:Hypothetical predicted protein [Octopus vulgaris]
MSNIDGTLYGLLKSYILTVSIILCWKQNLEICERNNEIQRLVQSHAITVHDYKTKSEEMGEKDIIGWLCLTVKFTKSYKPINYKEQTEQNYSLTKHDSNHIQVYHACERTFTDESV